MHTMVYDGCALVCSAGSGIASYVSVASSYTCNYRIRKDAYRIAMSRLYPDYPYSDIIRCEICNRCYTQADVQYQTVLDIIYITHIAATTTQ